MTRQLELFARRGGGPARSGSRPAQAPTKINARSPPEPFDFAAAIALGNLSGDILADCPFLSRRGPRFQRRYLTFQRIRHQRCERALLLARHTLRAFTQIVVQSQRERLFVCHGAIFRLASRWVRFYDRMTRDVTSQGQPMP
jgi:hypothetical protein